MNLTRTFKFLLTLSLLVALSLNTFAQEEAYERLPQNKLGLGFQLTGHNENTYSSTPLGGVIAYTIAPTMHIGAQVGFSYNTETENFEYLFSPYVKYYFDNIKYFRPFLMGQFHVVSFSFYDSNNSEYYTNTHNSLSASFGAEWFPYTSFSVYGGFRVVEYVLDPSQAVVGFGVPFLGVMWYL